MYKTITYETRRMREGGVKEHDSVGNTTRMRKGREDNTEQARR